MNPKTIGAFVCIALGCSSIAAADELTQHSTSQQTIRFAQGAGRTLDVRAIEGTITVEAYDGADVEITVNKSISASSPEGLREAERDVVLEQSDASGVMKAIVRYADQPACGDRSERRRSSWHELDYDVRYDFTIRAPRDTRLELCTINEGNIVVKGAQGDFVLRTVNGRINMTDMGGSGQATTVNGAVTASFVRAPRAPSTFKTINGDVTLTMPDGLAADLRMKTFNGGLFTDFEVQTLASATPVKSERRDGMFVYRSPGFTTVRAGGGGPELTLDTLNGDVRVLKRAR